MATLYSHTFSDYTGAVSLPGTFLLTVSPPDGTLYALVSSVIVKLYNPTFPETHTMKCRFDAYGGGYTDFAYQEVIWAGETTQIITLTFDTPVAVTKSASRFVFYLGKDGGSWVAYITKGGSPVSQYTEIIGDWVGTSFVDISGTIPGTSSLSGILEEPTERLYPPGPTYWYSTGNFYYQLLVQSDFTLGNPPPTGVENTDYVILGSTYLPNFIRTNRRLVAAAKNNFYYEDI